MEFNSLAKIFGLPKDTVAEMTWRISPRQEQLLEMIYLEHRMAVYYTQSGVCVCVCVCVSGAEMLMKVSQKKFVGAEIVWVHILSIASC